MKHYIFVLLTLFTLASNAQNSTVSDLARFNVSLQIPRYTSLPATGKAGAIIDLYATADSGFYYRLTAAGPWTRLTGGMSIDTTISLDTTTLGGFKVPFAINRKFYGSSKFLYDSVTQMLLAQGFGNVSYPTFSYLQFPSVGGDITLRNTIHDGSGIQLTTAQGYINNNGRVRIAETYSRTGIGASGTYEALEIYPTISFSAAAGDGSMYGIHYRPTFTSVTGRNYALMIESGDVMIGGGATLPDTSATVDIKNTTKGLLIPRMTSTEKNVIAGPATSLLVFDTTAQNFQWYSRQLSSWQNLSRPYKVYTATLTAAASDPTVTVLENTLGSIVWTREDPGWFRATLTGAFPANKTHVTVGLLSGAVSSGSVIMNWLGYPNYFTIVTQDPDGNAIDEALEMTAIEIRVYP